jgi:hypothetical protein
MALVLPLLPSQNVDLVVNGPWAHQLLTGSSKPHRATSNNSTNEPAGRAQRVRLRHPCQHGVSDTKDSANGPCIVLIDTSISHHGHRQTGHESSTQYSKMSRMSIHACDNDVLRDM